MADTSQSAAQTDEQDFSIPGQQDDAGSLGNTEAPPTPSVPPTAPATGMGGQPNGPAASYGDQFSGIKVDTDKKIHPHMLILGGIVRDLLTGIQNAPGNPNNAFDRGFMAASPQNQAKQQAEVSKALSEADQEKFQASVTGMKALQYEYLLKRLPQDMQKEHLDAISEFKQNLIKEGANVEAEGTDEKASDAQAFHLNGTDPRATGHAGRFYSLPTMDSSGKAKFDVVYVPNKDTLQNDFKWTDADGNEQTISAGTQMSAALGKFVEAQQKGAQNQTKAEHKMLADALGPKVPEGEINQTVSWLEGQQKQNTPLYQQNKAAVDQQIQSLRTAQKETQAQKEKQAAAGAARTEENRLKGKDVIVHSDEGEVLMSAHEAQQQGYDDFSTLTSQKAQDLKDRRANADASMDAMKQYQDTFREAAPKLKSGDRDALRVLTSHVNADAKNGILGGIIDDLPLVGPMSGYANKMLEGTMKSDQYNNLSPEGKKMLSQYAMAVVANFANMKQMLGSVGRNPQMIQAEMAQIPLPYIDAESAQQAFTTKIDDLNKRNSSIPKVFNKREEKMKHGLRKMAGQE